MGSTETQDKGEPHRKDFEPTGAGAGRKEGVKMSPGFLGQALWKDDPGVERGSQGGSEGNGKATCAAGPLIWGVRSVEVY